jgi:hypothetical protein
MNKVLSQLADMMRCTGHVHAVYTVSSNTYFTSCTKAVRNMYPRMHQQPTKTATYDNGETRQRGIPTIA